MGGGGGRLAITSKQGVRRNGSCGQKGEEGKGRQGFLSERQRQGGKRRGERGGVEGSQIEEED